MPDLINVILLGIIEGVTEFLPISSTGHLLIAQRWLGGTRSDVFNIVIQAGAILAVTLIYRERLWQLLRDWQQPDNRDYALKLMGAFMITAVLGFVATQLGFALPERITPIAWTLMIGGVWMLVAEHLAARKPDASAITWRVAVLVGLAQVVAGLLPGTSRSAATIFVALLAGTSNRPAATEFAFLVGIPTMYAASGYALLKAWRDGGAQEDWSGLGIAFTASTITAFVAVKWLLDYIRSNRFTLFAIYRIVFGAALLVFLPANS